MNFERYHLNVPDSVPLNKTPGEKYWGKLLERTKPQIRSLWEHSDDINQKKKKFVEHICIVGIETSKYCNRKCSYCPDSLPEYKRDQQTLMSNAVWSRILEDLVELDYKSTVSLNLYNEALADPTIFEKIKEVKKRLPQSFVKFNSNGDFLDRETLVRLSDCGLDAIFVSLHPPMNKPYADSDRLKAHQKFYEKIGYHGTIHNCEPGKSIRTDLSFKGMRVLVMSDNWYDTGTSRGGLVENVVKYYQNRREPCWRPFREFIISCEGFVLPCCQIFPDEPTNHKFFLGQCSRAQNLGHIFNGRC